MYLWWMGPRNNTSPTAPAAGRLVCIPDGKSYLVGAAPLTIGREPSSDVAVHSEEVSRAHAYILRTPQGFLLVDSSLHGTYVNAERVQAQRILADGDVVQVGGHSFRFELRSAAPDPADLPQAHPLALFRRLNNGVYVIGVSHAGRSNAFTAAWITQVSFEPLLLSLSINLGHFSYPLLKDSGVFSVNILRQGQLDLARHFGSESGRTTDKLAGQRWRPGRLGAPVLLDAAAYLECRVTGTTPAGDHELVLGQVDAGGLLDPDAAPMLYSETGDLDGSSALYPENF